MVLDAHTRCETSIHGVSLDPQRRKSARLLMWDYELRGFRNPLWRGEPPEPARMIIRLERQLRMSMGSGENLLPCMERNGIDRSVVLSVAPFNRMRESLRACGEEPRRRIPFASARPYQDWEEELRRGMEGGRRGLKIHPLLQRLAPEGPFRFQPLEAFAPYGRPVIAHGGELDYYMVKDGYAPCGDVRRLEPLIAAFPRVPFILGHTGPYHPERALELSRRSKRVYLESSSQTLEAVREALGIAGREGVIFGSGWPASDSGYALRIARQAAGRTAS